MFQIDRRVEELMEELETAGYEAYLVGGAVRNMFLGRAPSDYDIATSAKPDEIEAVFSPYKTKDIGKKFGTILVIYQGLELEVTSFRADGPYIDGRRPEKVFFTRKLEEDLSRRDFTINSLAYSKKRGLVDPFKGQEDIKRKIIRSVGNPYDRMEEDYLRILRAVRFSAELGFEIEEETFQACKEHGPGLKTISRERIRDEFFKMLVSKRPAKAIELMRQLGILGQIVPEMEKAYGFEQNNPYHSKDLYHHSLDVLEASREDLEIRLAALFHDLGKLYSYSEDEKGQGHFYGHNKYSREICENILKSLNTAKKTLETVSKLVYYHMVDLENFKEKGLKRLIRKLGEEDIFKLLALMEADSLSSNNKDIGPIVEAELRIREILDSDQALEERDLRINGRDLMELGFKQGRIIGEILDFLLEQVMEDNSLNQRDILLDLVKATYIEGK